MPACSLGGPQTAAVTYGRGKLSIRVTPGQAFCFIPTPELGIPGYYTLTNPGSDTISFINNETSNYFTQNANPPLAVPPGLPVTGPKKVGNGCLGNISAFTTQPLTAGGNANQITWCAARWTGEQYSQTGYTLDDQTGIRVDTPLYTLEQPAGDPDTIDINIRDAMQGRQMYTSACSMSTNIEVANDWQCSTEAYIVGSGDCPLGLGAATGITPQNDGNPSDSLKWAQNPLIAGFGPGAEEAGFAPYQSLSDGMKQLVRPVIQTGGGNNAMQFYEMPTISFTRDGWTRAGCSTFPTPNATPANWANVIPGFPDAVAANIFYYPGQAVHPPLLWGGEGQRNTTYQNAAGTIGIAPQFRGDLLDAVQHLTASYVMTPEAIGRIAQGAFYLINRSTAGTASLSLTFQAQGYANLPTTSSSYTMNTAVLPMLTPMPLTIGGNSGVGDNPWIARVASLKNMIAAADQAGQALAPAIRALLKFGARVAPGIGRMSGISHTTPPARLAHTIEGPSSKITNMHELGMAVGVVMNDEMSGRPVPHRDMTDFLDFERMNRGLDTANRAVTLGRNVWPMIAGLLEDE